MIDPAELEFLHRLANTAAGQGRHFASLLASACAHFVAKYRTYPCTFRRLTNECGCLIGIEVSGD